MPTRFRVDHPSRPQVHAWCGVDEVLGLFVGLYDSRRRQSYDRFAPDYDHSNPLGGALRFLVSHGFFTSRDLDRARSHGFNVERVVSDGDDRVVEFVTKFGGAEQVPPGPG